MATASPDRRNGRDRRGSASAAPAGVDRRLADRRQFPPSSPDDGPSPAARELLTVIDRFKIQRGLTRISVDQLLGLMEQMGYRRA